MKNNWLLKLGIINMRIAELTMTYEYVTGSDQENFLDEEIEKLETKKNKIYQELSTIYTESEIEAIANQEIEDLINSI